MENYSASGASVYYGHILVFLIFQEINVFFTEETFLIIQFNHIIFFNSKCLLKFFQKIQPSIKFQLKELLTLHHHIQLFDSIFQYFVNVLNVIHFRDRRRPERLVSRLKSVTEDLSSVRIVVIRQPKGPDGTKGFTQTRVPWTPPA